ncbi:MAG: glycosyltransferase [Lachnospiraceae bacterium]|nr:glycosyltransferase [Lachnospiraceae bacterium]
MQKKEPMVSIIVPIYNAEKYLFHCIESVLNQTYKNIEVILVDDGSSDNSLKICMEYSKADERIRIIQGSHQGVVLARKRGVKEAKGEYCIFVDSDDWIDKYLLESTVPMTEGGSVDIVNYNLCSVDNSGVRRWKYTVPEGRYKKESLKGIYGKMIFDFQYGCPGLIQSLCTKLIRKEVLWSCLKDVDQRITLGEDAAVAYPMMLRAEKVVVLHKAFYFYRIRPESMCHSTDDEIFAKVSLFQQYMQKVFGKYSKEYQLETQLRAYLLNYITKGIREMFSIKLENLYQMPMGLLSGTDRRIVLYGAGKVGKSYYRQLAREDNVDIVAWVDKGKAGQKIYDRRIESPGIISGIRFDKIMIAVKDWETAEEIKSELKKFVFLSQILWDTPRSSWWEREIEL